MTKDLISSIDKSQSQRQKPWDYLTKSQKIALGVLSFVVLVLPLSLIFVKTKTNLLPKATFPPTPPVSPSPSPFPGTPTPSPHVSPSPPVKFGDLNGDFVVDIADYSILASQFMQTGTNLSADLDSDGLVDISDYSLLIGNISL